jgi:hypothetical protein
MNLKAMQLLEVGEMRRNQQRKGEVEDAGRQWRN